MRLNFEKLMRIDRRVIFLVAALVVIIPTLVPLGLPTYVTRHTQSLFNAIEKIPPNSQPLLLVFDFEPSLMPELYPMTIAVLRHCFARNIRVIGITLYAAGAGLGEMAMHSVAKEYGKESGIDYAYLGYKPGTTAVILSLGENIHKTFPSDYYGNPVGELRIMDRVHNYQNIPLVVDVGGGRSPSWWIAFAGARYHVRLGIGVTAVLAADYYPFLQTGQVVGILSGLKGASEYEELLRQHNLSDRQRKASQGMEAISLGHLVIIGFIILGNLAYFGRKKRE